mmetsp:Transcript_69164/g.218786  ORF Transcript_69164/g.218786 Transcript_69164/m.218786 type:complete len:130 (-) Transcript_69164:68-457(-)
MAPEGPEGPWQWYRWMMDHFKSVGMTAPHGDPSREACLRAWREEQVLLRAEEAKAVLTALLQLGEGGAAPGARVLGLGEDQGASFLASFKGRLRSEGAGIAGHSFGAATCAGCRVKDPSGQDRFRQENL